jgi:elongation factor G
VKKEAPIDKVRIIGIFAHVDAGKTTTSEAILYFAGRIHRQGSIDEGTTQLDFMEQERERGITIMSAATACHWNGHRINLIDTPGHIDFTAEVVRSIRVIDGAITVVCGVGGVEPQTETVWMHASQENLARVIFVNKLDRQGASFARALDDIHDRLTPTAIPFQLPIGSEGTFRGLVDLLEMKALVWTEGTEEPTLQEVPEPMVRRVETDRERLVDAICETNEAMLEQRLEGIEPDLHSLVEAARRATISGQIVPVLCGASRNRIGVQPLLDAIVAYLPAPTDMHPVLGTIPGQPGEVVERADDPSAPFCGTAFKIVTDPHVGHLAWVRVFSGTVKAGDVVYNPRTDDTERVGRIYRMHGSQREQVAQMAASDVVAVVGLKSVTTGDTLCDPEHPIVLEAIRFPEPVISVALSAANHQDRDKVTQAVARLTGEDPTLVSAVDPETGELTLSGMGELHLEIALDRLHTDFGIRAQMSTPQVSYRETVRRSIEYVATYKKQSGGHGHFAEVNVRVEPLDRGSGIDFVNEAPPSEFPRDFVNPTGMGVRSALAKGVIAGFPVTDVRITVLGGRYHEVDSAAIDFQIAGSMAVREAIRRAQPTLLEPIMRIDVNALEDHLGNIVADIGRRRGAVNSMAVRGNLRNIDGEVPLSEARGYATDLRSLTQGRGSFTLEFRRYDLVPDSIAEVVVQERKDAGKVVVR